MKMNKAELIEIAESMGIKTDPKDTKKILLDKIYEIRNSGKQKEDSK